MIIVKEMEEFEDYREPSKQDLINLQNFIIKKLDESPIMFSEVEVYTEDDSIIIEVSLEWGDWKHDHLRLDYLMDDIIHDYDPNMGRHFGVMGAEVTEEDGSDTYSAIHSYGINFDYLYDE